MKLKSVLMTAVLAACINYCWAQTSPAVQYELPKVPSPLLILHVDGKVIEVDPDKTDVPEFESLVDARWVSSVEMVTGSEATMMYGDKGRNGVLIINFKENYILPLALQPKEKEGS